MKAVSPINASQSDDAAKTESHRPSVVKAAGKFETPYTDSSCHLFRQRIFQQLDTLGARGKKVITIEARAGAGKSILAAQYLQHIQAANVWYQIGPEDRDPVFLICTLLSAMTLKYPALGEGSLSKRVAAGTVTGLESARLAEIFAKDLSEVVIGSNHLLLDDLHLIEEVPESLQFLEVLMANSPLQFVLVSRHPFRWRHGVGDTLHVDGRLLDLTSLEVRDLFESVFHHPLLTEDVEKIHSQTEGWMMGVILAAQALMQNADSGAEISADTVGSFPGQAPESLAYFSNQVLCGLPADKCRLLLELSLLESIPSELAKSLFGASHAVDFLELLASRQFFIRRTRTPSPAYVFHHLFQECLRRKAESEMSEDDRKKILAEAGKWFYQNSRTEAALNCLLRAQKYSDVEKILLKEGMTLLGSNRTESLKQILSQIPHERVQSSGWLSYFFGAAILYTDPIRALPHLERATDLFVADEDPLGELMAITTRIAFHMGIDLRFTHGKTLLDRAETLYERLAAHLPPQARIQAASNIASGLGFFAAKFPCAKKYLEKALKETGELGFVDARAGVLFALGFNCAFQGDWAGCTLAAEQSIELLQDVQVSDFNRLGLLTMTVNFLALKGDFYSYKHQRGILTTNSDKKLQKKTMVESFLFVLDALAELVDGRLDATVECVQRGIVSNCPAAATEHLQSLYWSYYAYASALKGERGKALDGVKKSEELRSVAGGPFFVVVNQMLMGGVYTYLGDYSVAGAYLGEAISGSEGMGEGVIRAGAYAHRAFMHMNTERAKEAQEDLRLCLMFMEQEKHEHFFGWNPWLMEKVLAAAVCFDIKPEFARKLAAERLNLAILQDGEAIPILEVVTLGRMEFRLKGKRAGSFADFTPTQLELLGMLAAAPGHILSREEIETNLWPDAPPDKLRSKFDNLHSRLRKTLNSLFSPLPATHYLVVEKSHVRLQNCRVDARTVLELIKKGRRHFGRNESWQAENALVRVLDLYQGEYLPGIRLSNEPSLYREELRVSFIASARDLIQILKRQGRSREAITVAEKVFAMDPLDEPVVKLLYDLYVHEGKSVKARKTIETYKNTLETEGFSLIEISDIMNSIFSGS